MHYMIVCIYIFDFTFLLRLFLFTLKMNSKSMYEQLAFDTKDFQMILNYYFFYFLTKLERD